MANRIRDAIEVLARRGWTQGTFTDESGRHCLQGALYEAHGCQPRRHGALTRSSTHPDLAEDIRLVNETIAAEYPERVGAVGVSRFNDHPDTTWEDILLVLKHTEGILNDH